MPSKRLAGNVGAEFGGLACAEKVRKSASYSVTLVDFVPSQWFSPILCPIATALYPKMTPLQFTIVDHQRRQLLLLPSRKLRAPTD